MDMIQIVSLIAGFIGIVLMFVTYLYIDKLEKIGCACAAHPYQKFVKNYPLFAIAYLAITMFLPPSIMAARSGTAVGATLMAASFIFTIATVVFFVLALMYVRYLKVAKCACSEDVRREVLYWWALAELVILFMLVLIPIMFAVLAGAFALTVGTAGKISAASGQVREAAVNPLKSARKVPAAFKKSLKAMRK